VSGNPRNSVWLHSILRCATGYPWRGGLNHSRGSFVCRVAPNDNDITAAAIRPERLRPAPALLRRTDILDTSAPAESVRVTDVPAHGRGRAYLVERGLEHDGHAALKALVADYLLCRTRQCAKRMESDDVRS
jgi:hypothetical protein